MFIILHLLQDNFGLKHLNLAWNGFGEEGAKELAIALKTSSLSHLDLTNNRIPDEGFLALIKTIKDTDELRCLKVKKIALY